LRVSRAIWRQSLRLDNLDRRVERIERRLDLVEPVANRERIGSMGAFGTWQASTGILCGDQSVHPEQAKNGFI
jgi:hypothetical protein